MPTIGSTRLRYCPNCKFLRHMRYERTFYDTVERSQARDHAIKNGEYDPTRTSTDPLIRPFDPLDPRDAKPYAQTYMGKDFNEFDSAMPGLIALSGLDGVEKHQPQTTLVSPDVLRDATHDDHDIHLEHDDDVQHLATTPIQQASQIAAPDSLADASAPRIITSMSNAELVPDNVAVDEEQTPPTADITPKPYLNGHLPHTETTSDRGVVHPAEESKHSKKESHPTEYQSAQPEDTSDIAALHSRSEHRDPIDQDDAPYDGPPVVIGLAGGIASGKSTVATVLGDMGFHVIDVDSQAKSALQQPQVRDQLVSLWGDSILNESSTIDRTAIAALVTKDPAKRRTLEEVVRPWVRMNRDRALAQAHAAGKTGVVLDAPQLFETSQNAECDLVIFVEAPGPQRIARAADRGWTQEHHAKRESAQLSIDEKRRRSHAIIVNDSSPAALTADVKAVVRQVRSVVAG